MQVKFTKLTNDKHRLEIIRDDGSTEAAELETKSSLWHDFVHLAFETEADLKKSFWGLVAAGHSFLALSGKDPNPLSDLSVDELLTTEMIVGPLSSYLQSTGDVEGLLSGLEVMFTAHNLSLPDYVTAECIQKTGERLRLIQGQWLGTPFGQTMTLIWPIS